jgi:tRNA (guanine-N7-)-methyltransferase
VLLILKRTVIHAWIYTYLLGEGHEVVCYHNVYVNVKEVRGGLLFRLLKKQYLEVNKAITYIRFKIKE